jgi:hypothetical protein
MAHAAVKDPVARLIEQCSQGRKIRNIQSKGFSVATDRAANDADSLLMADVIRAETEIFGFFVAPCDCKVVRVYANGSPFVDSNGGTGTAKLTKAVIAGVDVDLCSTIAIGADTVPTLDTAIDAVLSTTSGALNLLEGQHVYATVAISNHAVEAVGYVTLCMEWVPTDSP